MTIALSATSRDSVSLPIICYDRSRIIQRHVDDGMTEEEANEFFEFNQIGAWVGDTTPCFITLNSTDT